MTLVDAVGTTGTLLVVLAYLGTQLRALDAAGLAFPVVNLIGSLLITVSLWVNFNLASALMEGFWIAISLFGIARWARERQQARGGNRCQSPPAGA
ncbi:hypothetical protein GWK16_15405 [Roseomonas sp. JC162]|uniref:CBU-0592-like domain-containing protein n=1 Tax=Neoroseomonas marina TaxID=1232220 RepID=A0A848EGS9_9PROT|nr:hypothetical protein [Neoroseomonas marina]